MNAIIPTGIFLAVETYLSMNGFHYFVFDFVAQGDHIDIYCTKHPSLNGQNSSVSNTHLYSSGKICFVVGKEPRTRWEAQKRAKQWAEYFLEYRRTGKAQS
jgi:hypothetical protein